jgi:DNA-binding NtrC family response regulator
MATVLIVESYPNLAALYRDILSEEGHRVLVASNSKEAKDIALAKAIDLVVMDEGLQDGSEEELMEKLKTLRPNIKAIICFLDQFSPKTYRDLCDEGFLKTYDYTILQQKIDDLSRRISGHDREGF